VAVLLLIGGAAILVGVGMWKGALSRGAKRSFVVSALGWIGGWVFFLGWPETFAARGHVVSAIAMFTGIIAVVIVNAIGFKKAYPAKEGTGASINRYMIIAAVMGLTLVTAVVAHLTLAKFDQLVFWLETALIVEFAVFWIMQTQELGVRVARPALRAGAEGDAFDEEGDSARH
jgi:hypothetical protein